MSAAAFWLAAGAAAVIGLLLNEAVDLGAWIAPKIVQSASSRMPTRELRERYREEWLAELNAFDGLKLIKLGKAISLWAGSWRVARVLRSQPDTIGLRTYLRRLLLAYIWVAKSTWKGLDFSPSGLPEIALIVFISQLSLGPIGGRTGIVIGKAVTSPDGGYTIGVSVSCQTDTTKSVERLTKLSSFTPIVFYDLYLLRKRTSLKKLIRYHLRAWRDLRGLRIIPDQESSSPRPSS